MIVSVCSGLGVIGTNQTGAKVTGLHIHSSFVVDPTNGLPMGVLASECVAPEPKSKDAGEAAIEDKKTFSWIVGLGSGHVARLCGSSEDVRGIQTRSFRISTRSPLLNLTGTLCSDAQGTLTMPHRVPHIKTTA